MMDDDLLNLPESLRSISGIGKERLIELKARRMLGLALSHDEPLRDVASGKVVPWMAVIHMIHRYAKRYMLPGGKVIPMEDRPEWTKKR